jgi:hypothetical protein
MFHKPDADPGDDRTASRQSIVDVGDDMASPAADAAVARDAL